MNRAYKIVIPFDFEHNEVEKLKESLSDLSENKINFYDKSWRCDKIAKNINVDEKDKYTIYYKDVPTQYEDWIRYYALAMFRHGNRVQTMKNNISDMNKFFQFLEEHYNSIPIENVDITEMNRYKEYLKSSSLSEDTKHGRWSAVSNFYIKMKGAGGYFKENIVDKNPFIKKRNNDSKYISEYVINQLDSLYKDEELPLAMRAAYWIMRFIPSRIEEVYKIPIDCIKDIKGGWTITLNMEKQNGGYFEPELRVIRFKNESKEGRFLYDLLKKQEMASRSLQDSLPNELKGYFFTYKQFIYRKGKSGKGRYFEKTPVIIASECSIQHFINIICKRYDIRDEEGNVAHFTSHMLRHNGITDRICDGGNFEADDVAAITHHKNTMMICNNYLHPTEKQILESQKKVLKVRENTKKLDEPIYFQGRIMNINPALEKRLLRDLKKHKMKLGICSDIEECKHQYRCLEDCEFYIPDCDDLPYFENEIEQWSRKVKYYKAQNLTNSLENAEYNLKIHMKVRNRILNLKKEEELWQSRYQED